MENQNNLCDKLTSDRIRALPIAQRSWSIPKLRRLCTDTFRLQLSFAWTPAEDLEFQRSKKRTTKLCAGTVYGGIPYAIGGLGNLYRWMEIYDEKTGVMTVPKELPREFYKLFCNQCSFGSFWAWSRVSNSLTYKLTNDMMDRNGCIPIGEYSYDPSITDFADYTTTRICEENGRQAMFRSYAVLQEADGIVNFTTGGHVRMISAKPVVYYNEDGSIDGEESYTTFLDQAAKYHTMLQSDGSEYLVQGGVDTKISFEKLFTAGYLPFTIPELAQIKGRKRKRVDIASASLKGWNEEESTPLGQCTAISNYPISHLIFTAHDKDGGKLDRLVFYPLRGKNAFARFEQSLDFLSEDTPHRRFVEKYEKVTISMVVGNGREFTVFKGKPTL
ncbi:MAG: hypothetical protein E7580_06795 [Ruminococcaceae bacterium]|nr:hypothetical protein [Oscillospiraceae bacterium]